MLEILMTLLEKAIPAFYIKLQINWLLLYIYSDLLFRFIHLSTSISPKKKQRTKPTSTSQRSHTEIKIPRIADMMPAWSKETEIAEELEELYEEF